MTALPARPEVRVLDLLRAIDGAALAGDLFGVRALTAAAVHQLEREDVGEPESAAAPVASTEGGAS